MDFNSKQNLFTLLSRGLKKKCPRCGEGDLYFGWNKFQESCPVCAFEFKKREGDCWAFLYITTAGLTGFLALIMILTHPPQIWQGQIAVGFAAVFLIVLTVPYRKGVALAVDYWLFPTGVDENSPEN
jgi:uncharacterized protein (DUF983 family)